MNAKSTILALALMAIAPAWAGNSPVSELAQRSGLSERKVQMVLGNRTAYAEYRYTYQKSLEKLVAAIGEDGYQRLMQGKAVALHTAEGGYLAVQVPAGRDDASL